MNFSRAVTALVFGSVMVATEAQAQTTMHACYVKNTGTVYRIKTTGTPTKCSTNHTEFSWNMEGQEGPKGEQGPQGPAGPSGWPGVVLTTTQHTVQAGALTDFLTTCGAGQVLLTGGYHIVNTSPEIQVLASAPYYQADGPDSIYGWHLRIKNNLAGGVVVTGLAYCRMVIN